MHIDASIIQVRATGTLYLYTYWSLTLKGPGLFVYLKSGGGADSAPPPSDLGHGATKNSQILHVRRVSRYERADKIAIY